MAIGVAMRGRGGLKASDRLTGTTMAHFAGKVHMISEHAQGNVAFPARTKLERHPRVFLHAMTLKLITV